MPVVWRVCRPTPSAGRQVVVPPWRRATPESIRNRLKTNERGKSDMSAKPIEAPVIENQEKILANQDRILANQLKLEKVLENQTVIVKNQEKLDKILANQELILKNQKLILEK
jgi:hypothetical protein